MSKTPFNWVGNKYKYIDNINNIIKNKSYDIILDTFMGSGNIILNVKNNNKNCLYIGNDYTKLIPNIFNALKYSNYVYKLEDIESIINNFNRFSNKDDYYVFRDYWNKKYLSNNFDKYFVLETILLLKMCSNSMVRFNPKEGYFNQGFRGLGKKKEFFTQKMKEMCISQINYLSNIIYEKYIFINKDFKEIDYKAINKYNTLLILDPPYSLRNDMYSNDWTKEDDTFLNNIINECNNDFIYFNYIMRDGIKNEKLLKIIEDNNFRVIKINDKTMAGQGRDKNIKDVEEVIVTNIMEE